MMAIDYDKLMKLSFLKINSHLVDEVSQFIELYPAEGVPLNTFTRLLYFRWCFYVNMN